MPKPYPKEFREDVVRVARNREPGVTLEQIAADFGVHPITLSKWLRRADTDGGARPATASGESAELREAPNRLWLTDITEHATGEGKLYLCAVKDVYSGRIVGYPIDSRMKSSLTVSAVARRGQVAGCIVHSDRGSQFRARKYVAVFARHSLVARWAESVRQATTRPWRASSRCCRRMSSTADPGGPGMNSGSPS
ncbi:hypothetical protein P405_17595 [Streptomyces sp. FR-008]|nr:IS3/IS911 family transposase [Streptomyces sp. FR-008]KAF0794926.1 hypothetical protein P405_17595 [Streptomyces sp. FR-008]